MKRHDRNGGTITFREFVGDGTYKGVDFTLGVAMTPAGTLLGMPMIAFDDGKETTVTFELSDLLPMAAEFAGLEES